MEKCFYSRQYRTYSWIDIVCGLLTGNTLILVGLFVQCENVLGCGILLALGSAIIVYTALFVIFLNRRYDVNDKGITIQYLGRFFVFYPWESVEFACVGITHRSGTGTTQDTVIWCTTKKQKHQPPTASRRHISWEHDFYYCSSIITIEFSEERYRNFSHYYVREIPDYR